MAAARGGVSGLRDEWRNNQRLRWGVLAIAAILLGYAVLLLNDWRLALHEQYRQSTLRLYKVAALNGKDEWIARAQEAAALRKALQSQVPAASSPGMAQADAQGWVKQLVTASGRQLATEGLAATRVDADAGVWKVPITVRGEIGPSELVEMLRRIESSDRLIVVDALNHTNRQRPNMVLTISAYYRLPPAREGDDRGPG